MTRLLRSCATRCAATLFVFAAAAFSGDAKTRRLETVTWNPSEHKLTWIVSSGEVDPQGGFKAKTSQTYVIDMDAATMSYSGEDRKFSSDEATRVHRLMDLVAKYAVESTVWWDDGQGEKLDKNRKRDQTVKHTTPAPERSRETTPRSRRPSPQPTGASTVLISLPR